MRTKNAVKWISILGILFFSFPLVNVSAQEEQSQTATTAQDDSMNPNDWKQEFASDRQAMKDQREKMKNASEADRAEEKEMMDQILKAQNSGDMDTAKSLREQLRTVHKENKSEKREDFKEMREMRKELNADRKEAM